MKKVEQIFTLYSLLHRLKNLPRSGGLQWGLKPNVRVESVAEHVFGTCALAASIFATQKTELNLEKVFTLLALHETEEAIIGDITPYEEEYAQKEKLAKQAIQEIFEGYANKEQILAYIDEFNEKSTPEAQFAYMCDKLEADLQVYMYGDVFEVEKAMQNLKTDAELQMFEKQGYTSVAQKFLQHDKKYYTGICKEMAEFLEEKESANE